MKMIVTSIFISGLALVSCKKEPQNQPSNTNAVMSTDSTVSGAIPVSPDTADNTSTVDITSYDVDSIKKSK